MKVFTSAASALLPSLMFATVSALAGQPPSPEPVQIADLPSDSVIVFGELHGTKEIPAFFGEQVEALVSAGHTVHVGLEMAASDQDELRAAMNLPEDERHSALLQIEQWRTGKDGRNSLAMARMLGRLGELQSRFEDRLSLFAFDIPADWRGTSNDRDQFMAGVIAERRAQLAEEDYLLVLSGNAHAFGVPGAPWDPDFRSMTTRLKKNHRVVTLRNLQSGGEAWICTPECGARSVSGVDRTYSRGIHLEPFDRDWADQPVYDGVFFVGQLSASEPLPVAVEMTENHSDGVQ